MAAVKAIPDGFHTVTPHLIVSDVGKALDFYAKAFGAKVQVNMPGPDGKPMHAQMQIGDSPIMLAPENLEMGSRGPLSLGGSSVTLNIYGDDADAMFKRATDAGATGRMPPEDMFWGDRYGQVVDPFGHVWAIATHKKDLTPAEMKKAMDEFFAKMAHA
ncbi:MAG TPA: VOC family protein [Gemmatimonadaceae bacterium]|jgi:PhnB protein|nr:VOC family protein [Gemmatimonadaceae bacterium]